MDPGSSSGRRRGPGFVTPTACTECRKKRAKCDGRNPCSRCVAYHVAADCTYETSVRQTKEDMRAEIDQLRQYARQSKRVLDAIASHNKFDDILEQLQSGVDIEDISKTLDATSSAPSIHDFYNTTQDMMVSRSRSMSSSNLHQSFSAVESRTDRSPLRSGLQSRRDFGQKLILGDEIDDSSPLSHHGPKLNNQSWTAVTTDAKLVEHLLALYFCWEYPIFATVSKEHFMEDFRKGYTRYCSSFLVNALLALACRFSDKPKNVLNVDNHIAAGDIFFAEALNLYQTEQDHHSLTSIQALGVMSIREASFGRINESSFLSTSSIRLAIEMGLHERTMGDDEVNDDRSEEDNMDESVRRATFWGAYSLNEMLSLCTGTLPCLPRYITNPMKPGLVPHIEEAFWTPYTDDGTPMDQHFNQPSNLRSVYKTFCELSEIVHSVLYTFYSPGSEIDSRTLIELYNKYIQWYDTIPETLRFGHNYTPSVLFAHLFYHSATLLIFQPYFDLRLSTSAVVPKEVCYQAADAIVAIVTSYSELYSLRRTPSFVPYFVLIATIIHMVAVEADNPDDNARKRLLEGISHLEEMSKCHGFALRAISALRYLARRWKVDLSPEVGDPDVSEMDNTASAAPGQFYPDYTILQTLQSLQPILSSRDPQLFSSVPTQGLPNNALGFIR